LIFGAAVVGLDFEVRLGHCLGNAIDFHVRCASGANQSNAP
jgi:hypothetical protein